MKFIAVAMAAAFVALAAPAAAQTCPAPQVRADLPGKLFRCDPPVVAPAPSSALAGTPAASDGPLAPTVTVVAPTTGGGGLFNIGQAFGPLIEPYVNALVQALLAAALGWLALQLKTRWGIQIDLQHMNTIQVATQNRASSLVADGAVKLAPGSTAVDVKPVELTKAANDLIAANPDAAKNFGLTTEKVKAMIVDKMPTVPAVASAQATAMVRNPQGAAPTDAGGTQVGTNPPPVRDS